MCYNNTARKYGKKRRRGDMAQLVERRVRNAKVRGSNPLISTTDEKNELWSKNGVRFFSFQETFSALDLSFNQKIYNRIIIF